MKRRTMYVGMALLLFFSLYAGCVASGASDVPVSAPVSTPAFDIHLEAQELPQQHMQVWEDAASITVGVNLENARLPSGGYACPGTGWSMTRADVENALSIRLEAITQGKTVTNVNGNKHVIQTFAPASDMELFFQLHNQLATGTFQFLDDTLACVDLTFLPNQPSMGENGFNILYDELAQHLCDLYGVAQTERPRELVLEGSTTLMESMRWEADDALLLAGNTALQITQFYQENTRTGVVVSFARLGLFEAE